MSENKISVVINTYNACEFLYQVLDSVKGFDEIVVCDMESTDNTLDIARQYNAKTVIFPRGEYNIVEHARNFAISHASYKYILVVDADELVTRELHDYLYSMINSANCPQGLAIPRKNKFMGKFGKEKTEDYQLRFFIKQGTFWPEHIHSVPQVQGTVKRIPNTLKNVMFIHLAQENLHQRLEKINRYTDNEVSKKADRNFSAAALFYRPAWFFFRS